MRDKNCVKLAEEFLKRKFEESEYFADKKSEKDYRFEHSVRVANIGKEIAVKALTFNTFGAGLQSLADVIFCERNFEEVAFVNSAKLLSCVMSCNF